MQSEVASLAEARAKVTSVFTPYIIPDASVLCTGLHLIKEMMKSEKFIIVVAIAGKGKWCDHDATVCLFMVVRDMIILPTKF